MENFNEKQTGNIPQDSYEDNFTEREPTNEERWVNDVNKEFDEDVPLVNEVDPDEDIPFEDEDKFDAVPPLDDDEIDGEITSDEPEEDFDDDDLFPEDDEELEADADDVEFK